jgi:hypothetical protein
LIQKNLETQLAALSKKWFVHPANERRLPLQFISEAIAAGRALAAG